MFCYEILPLFITQTMKSKYFWPLNMNSVFDTVAVFFKYEFWPSQLSLLLLKEKAAKLRSCCVSYSKLSTGVSALVNLTMSRDYPPLFCPIGQAKSVMRTFSFVRRNLLIFKCLNCCYWVCKNIQVFYFA